MNFFALAICTRLLGLGPCLHWPKLGYIIIAKPVLEAKETQSSDRPELNHKPTTELQMRTRTENEG